MLFDVNLTLDMNVGINRPVLPANPSYGHNDSKVIQNGRRRKSVMILLDSSMVLWVNEMRAFKDSAKIAQLRLAEGGLQAEADGGKG